MEGTPTGPGRTEIRTPRRRKPSPTGKVDRAQPGPDEGKQPKSEKQAPLNGSNFHPMWPVSLFGCGPLIRHALRRATFPVGEGDLPAGAFHTLSLERVAGPKALTGVGRQAEPTWYRPSSAAAAAPSPRGRSRAFISTRRRERCFPRHGLPDPGPWPGSSRWALWPPGPGTSPGSCGPGT